MSWKENILQFAYQQKINEIVNYVNFGLQDKIYPSEIALEKEKLPIWLIVWLECAENDKKLNFLSEIGVHTNNSTIAEIRNYFVNNAKFDHNKIAIDSGLSDGKLLINTLLFLKEKGLELSDDKQYSVIKEIVRVVNSNALNENKLTINDIYNSEEILKNSTLTDKKTKDYQIFLHKGKLPSRRIYPHFW